MQMVYRDLGVNMYLKIYIYIYINLYMFVYLHPWNAAPRRLHVLCASGGGSRCLATVFEQNLLLLAPKCSFTPTLKHPQATPQPRGFMKKRRQKSGPSKRSNFATGGGAGHTMCLAGCCLVGLSWKRGQNVKNM